MCENVRKCRHWTGEFAAHIETNAAISNEKWSILIRMAEWDSVSLGDVLSI